MIFYRLVNRTKSYLFCLEHYNFRVPVRGVPSHHAEYPTGNLTQYVQPYGITVSKLSSSHLMIPNLYFCVALQNVTERLEVPRFLHAECAAGSNRGHSWTLVYRGRGLLDGSICAKSLRSFFSFINKQRLLEIY